MNSRQPTQLSATDASEGSGGEGQSASRRLDGGGLRVENLDVSYGKAIALHNVTIHAPMGKMTAVLGRNGAGKTTLCRSILGLVSSKAGSINFNGLEFTRMSGWRRVRMGHIGFVPQGGGAIAQFSVGENIALGAYGRTKSAAEEAARREEVLELFPVLRSRFAKLAGTLSGGERQMLSLAVALMGKPEVIILDEPSFGLAPTIVETVFTTLREISASGTCVLFSEESRVTAMKFASYVYVLDRGEVRLHGDAMTVNEDPVLLQSLFT
jgi:branched-chain amino acid transport system ATP-binding protein